MTEPVLHTLPGRSRHYVRTDTGRIVPSVTTIVGLTPKPYLLNWVVKLAAEFAAEYAEGLAEGLCWEERVATIKDNTRTLREEGAKKGTALHEFAELYLWLGLHEGDLNNAQQGVVDILERLQPQVLYTEAKVWNGSVGYAGTLDGVWRVATADGYETWLVDWKSSKSRSAEWAMQLEAYAQAETIFTEDGREHAMPYIDRTVVLWTPYEGPAGILPINSTPADWQAFLSAAQVLQWTETRKIADVFGPLEIVADRPTVTP